KSSPSSTDHPVSRSKRPRPLCKSRGEAPDICGIRLWQSLKSGRSKLLVLEVSNNMPIEDSLKKILRRAADETSAPNLEQFCQRRCEYPTASPNARSSLGVRGVFLKSTVFAWAGLSAVVTAVSAFWFVTIVSPAGFVAPAAKTAAKLQQWE